MTPRGIRLVSACLCRHIFSCSLLLTVGLSLFCSDIKIVQFRNGLEGRASQMSSVQVLFNSKYLLDTEPEGIRELISSCKVGNATKSKLRKVAEWTIHTKCALGESHHQVKATGIIQISLTGVWTCTCLFHLHLGAQPPSFLHLHWHCKCFIFGFRALHHLTLESWITMIMSEEKKHNSRH